MSRLPELRAGDCVLVRGTVEVSDTMGAYLLVSFGPLARARHRPETLDIVCVEPRSWAVGDRVIAEGHHGTVLCVWPDGELLWVRPDGGNGKPWTVSAADCRREPPAPPSAEVVPFKEAAE